MAGVPMPSSEDDDMADKSLIGRQTTAGTIDAKILISCLK